MNSEPKFLVQLSIDDLRNLRRALRTADMIEQRVAFTCRSAPELTKGKQVIAEVSWSESPAPRAVCADTRSLWSVTLKSQDGSPIDPGPGNEGWAELPFDLLFEDSWSGGGLRGGGLTIDLPTQSWGRPDPEKMEFFITRGSAGSWLEKLIRKPTRSPEDVGEAGTVPGPVNARRSLLDRLMGVLKPGRKAGEAESAGDGSASRGSSAAEDRDWWIDERDLEHYISRNCVSPEEHDGMVLLDQTVPGSRLVPRMELEDDPGMEKISLEEVIRIPFAFDFALGIDGLWHLLKRAAPPSILAQAVWADIEWHSEYDDYFYSPRPTPTFRRADGSAFNAVPNVPYGDLIQHGRPAARPWPEDEAAIRAAEAFETELLLHHDMDFSQSRFLPAVRLNLATGDWGGPDWEKFRIYGANLACFPWSPPMP